MLARASAKAAEAVRSGGDATKGWALPHKPKLSFLAGPGDKAGPDDHMSTVTISSIRWPFLRVH